MRAIEQIAMKTNNITQRIKDVGSVYPFNGHMTEKIHPTEWIHDKVHAVHVYLNPNYSQQRVGSEFEVQLAFNYDIIPQRELELIQLLSGETVQLMKGEPGEGLSHLGYHIPDNKELRPEMDWWNVLGFTVAQISVTTDHTGTAKRYIYAFIDTRSQIGVFTKAISRVSYPRPIEGMIEEFSRVNTVHLR